MTGNVTSTTNTKASTLTLVGLILAVSMTTIDQTIVALSAPTIESELGLSHGGVQWAINVYLLTMAAVFLLGGRLADVWGHKKMVLVGISGFALFSLLCGLTPTGEFAEAWLVTARALQGASGALMFPAAIGIVVQTFPKEGRAKAMATFFAFTGAMTAVGPIAGGYLTAWTWRSIFWINIPIAIAAIIIVIISAARTPRRDERIDWVGALLAALGMASIVFGLQQASQWGWASIGVWGVIVLGFVILTLFVLFERRMREPLIRLEAFKDRAFTVSALSILFSSFAFLSAFYFLSVYGQVSLRLTAINTGLLFLKFFIGFVIAAQLGARVFDRGGARPVLFLGGLAGAAGFAWLAWISTDLSISGNDFVNPQLWPLLLSGAGVGFMFSAASTDTVNRAIGSTYGEVSAVTQTMKNFGGSIGIAVLTSLVTVQLSSNLTASIVGLGGTEADAQNAINQISGAGDANSSGRALGEAPAELQTKILDAVSADYANAVQWAFYGMAAAMIVVFLLALVYPKGRLAPTADPLSDPQKEATASA